MKVFSSGFPKLAAAGFTLLEMMITLVILSILVTMAIPAFTISTKNQRLASAAGNLIAELNYARSEAVREGRKIMVSSINSTCCGVNNGEWGTRGYGSWADTSPAPSGDGIFTFGADTILRQIDSVGPNVTATARDTVNNPVNTVIFYSDGTTNTSFTISVCDDRANEDGKYVDVLASGVVVALTTATAAGMGRNCTAVGH